METKCNPLIFIVDDDLIYQQLLKNELEQNHYTEIEIYSSGSDCLNNLHKKPDIIILDYNLQEKLNGVQVMKKIKELNPHIHVIIISAQERLEVVINSVKYGAYDYVMKNEVAIRRMSQLIKRICKWNALLSENMRFTKRRNLFLAGLSVLVVTVMVLRVLFPGHFV
jgi:DNA-binding NtrC family response regulator